MEWHKEALGLNRKTLKTLEYQKVLYTLSQQTATSRGKEWVMELSPSSDLEEVKRRLTATDEAMKWFRLKGGISFGGIRDIRSALSRAKIGGMLSTRELLDVAQTLTGGRRVKRQLTQFHDDHPIALIYTLAEQITEHRDHEQAIERCVDEHAEVKDQASATLQKIRQNLRSGEARIRERLEQMIRTSSVQKMLQEQLITIRNNRFVIPIKHEYRSHFGGIIHDQSSSGATLFVEPESIVQLNNQLRELKLKEEQEIERILQLLSAQVADIEPYVQNDLEILAELDFIFAKAGLAEQQKAVLPRMNDRGFFKLQKARHPLIPYEEVKPIDVELGNMYSTIIITGPNTGGKTVSLKTIGLLHLMAMSGLFIPAEDGSQLCVFDGIFADIGDEQSIEQNLSTFSSHMTNIIDVLTQLTEKSLVLFDELGAGTDPAEGSALAIALLDHIRHVGCRMIATTHFSELKAYAYQQKGVINASMEFDIESLSPTYRLLVGVPGRSNAFAIAERLGLSRAIIDHARGQLGEDDQKVESMIASLEQNRLTAEAERLKAEKLRQEMETRQKRLEKEQYDWENKRASRLEKAAEEAAQIVKQAKAEAEAVMKDLRKLAREGQSAIKEHKLIEARKRLDEAVPDGERLKKPHPHSVAAAQKVKPGDEVLVPRLGQKGYVVEEASDTEWFVQLGIMKMKVNKNEVQWVKGKPQEQTIMTTNVKRGMNTSVKTELDLRGTNLEEAYIETDRFLDDAMMNGLGQVSVIHGKGTGVLRSGIQQFLQNHRQVKSFRYGAYNEGGNGVTIVELR